MEIISFDDGIERALVVLRAGGVIAHATETCYGLACDLRSSAAVEKTFAIKKRDRHQPISALFASVMQAQEFVVWNERAEELAVSHLPGALTLILPLRSDAPSRLLPTPDGGKTLGVRVSSHMAAQTLVEKFGSPLSTTSANVHGQPATYCAEDIATQFSDQQHQPDLILNSGRLPPNPPSKVLDLTEETIVQKR